MRPEEQIDITLKTPGGWAVGTAAIPSNYPFNGNANDAKGTANPSSIGTTLTYTQDRFGSNDKACLFDGTINSRISINSIIIDQGDAFTVSIWIKDNSTVNSASIIYCPLFDFLRNNISSDFSYNIYNSYSSSPSLSLKSSFKPNEWTHLAGTFSNNTHSMELYINGSLANLTTTREVFLINIKVLGISYDWKGVMDDLRIYNRVLSASEISQLYQYQNK